jgi:hypothetical protein
MTRPPLPGEPTPVDVLERNNQPAVVAGERVEEVLEFWVVQNGWWTEHAVNRRYWEVVTVRGRRIVVFHDLETGGWCTQAA